MSEEITGTTESANDPISHDVTIAIKLIAEAPQAQVYELFKGYLEGGVITQAGVSATVPRWMPEEIVRTAPEIEGADEETQALFDSIRTEKRKVYCENCPVVMETCPVHPTLDLRRLVMCDLREPLMLGAVSAEELARLGLELKGSAGILPAEVKHG